MRTCYWCFSQEGHQVWEYGYVHTRVHVCVSVSIWTLYMPMCIWTLCIPKSAYMHVYRDASIYVCINMHTHVDVCGHINMQTLHAWLCIYVSMPMCTCVYVCMHVCNMHICGVRLWHCPCLCRVVWADTCKIGSRTGTSVTTCHILVSYLESRETNRTEFWLLLNLSREHTEVIAWSTILNNVPSASPSRGRSRGWWEALLSFKMRQWGHMPSSQIYLVALMDQCF